MNTMVARQAGIVSGCTADLSRYPTWVFDSERSDSLEARGKLRALAACSTDAEKSADRISWKQESPDW